MSRRLLSLFGGTIALSAVALIGGCDSSVGDSDSGDDFSADLQSYAAYFSNGWGGPYVMENEVGEGTCGDGPLAGGEFEFDADRFTLTLTTGASEGPQTTRTVSGRAVESGPFLTLSSDSLQSDLIATVGPDPNSPTTVSVYDPDAQLSSRCSAFRFSTGTVDPAVDGAATGAGRYALRELNYPDALPDGWAGLPATFGYGCGRYGCNTITEGAVTLHDDGSFDAAYTWYSLYGLGTPDTTYHAVEASGTFVSDGEHVLFTADGDVAGGAPHSGSIGTLENGTLTVYNAVWLPHHFSSGDGRYEAPDSM